jgi:hypothetical protein
LGRDKERLMTEQKSPAELLAEASSEDTRSFIRRVKRAALRWGHITPTQEASRRDGLRADAARAMASRARWIQHSLGDPEEGRILAEARQFPGAGWYRPSASGSDALPVPARSVCLARIA